jgi:hypothetical protein
MDPEPTLVFGVLAGGGFKSFPARKMLRARRSGRRFHRAGPLPAWRTMAILPVMTNEGEPDRDRERSPDDDRQQPGSQQRSASQDLAEGLELMMRAARKAVRGIETSRIDELGRKARTNLERIDRRKVEQFGRKAAQKLDPRRIEEIAEDAGRELFKVVERVADRVEGVVEGLRSAPPASDEQQHQPAQQGSDSSEADSSSDEAKARVRIEDE